MFNPCKEKSKVKVQIRFYGDLKDKYGSLNEDGIIELFLEENSKIQEVFERLQIDDGEVGIVALNGKKVQKEGAIYDGDFIQILPFVAGG